MPRIAIPAPPEIAKHFTRVRVDKVEELLQTLATLGQARELPGEKNMGDSRKLTDSCISINFSLERFIRHSPSKELTTRMTHE
ncbi:MAG TPA: hypothetical protein PKE55_13085 [Kiritimatiellia bacterium]|nr:hypothetical protein [Kiritimatiellia bacterium]